MSEIFGQKENNLFFQKVLAGGAGPDLAPKSERVQEFCSLYTGNSIVCVQHIIFTIVNIFYGNYAIFYKKSAVASILTENFRLSSFLHKD
jgi:hypothetical protein